MIKPNELRIGNWIVEHNKQHQVTVIQDIKKGEGVTGIPLTEEVLQKCGFKPWNGTTLVDEACDSGIAFSPGSLKCYTDVPDPNNDHWFSFRYDFDNIKYLHQLQNLVFALTGKELEYIP